MNREQVKKSISQATLAYITFGSQPNTDFVEFDPELLKGWDGISDVILTAAEPHIRADERRKVLEELVGWIAEHESAGYSSVGLEWGDVADWLRSHMDPTP